MGRLILTDRAWPVDFWIGRTGSPYMTPSGPCWDCRTLNSPGSALRGSANKAGGQSNAITAMPELRSMLMLGVSILTMAPWIVRNGLHRHAASGGGPCPGISEGPKPLHEAVLRHFLAAALATVLNLLAGEGPVFKNEALQFAYAIGLTCWYRLQSEKRSHR